MKVLFQVLVVLAVAGAITWYTHHIWSDCLEDNTVLTCARMLIK
jgi:hypothetical protein